MIVRGLNLGVAILCFITLAKNTSLISFLAGVMGIINIWIEFGINGENWGIRK